MLGVSKALVCKLPWDEEWTGDGDELAAVLLLLVALFPFFGETPGCVDAMLLVLAEVLF